MQDLNYHQNVSQISQASFAPNMSQHSSFALVPYHGNNIPLPPPVQNPHNIRPPNTVNLNPGNAGNAFAPRISHPGTSTNDDVSQISQVLSVTINGSQYNGPIYDSNGNQLN